MKLKLTRNHIIAFIIAIAFILFGVFQAIFKFNVDQKVINEISFVLFIIVAGLIFSSRKKKGEKSSK